MIGTMTFSALAQDLAGELAGGDIVFAQLSTDSRSIIAGSVYLALIGEHFDGNEFVNQAHTYGAVAAIVSRAVDADMPVLKVADTHVALGRIAALNRLRSKAKVIALTGSQGKTTVKEILGAILSSHAPTLVTEANLNNTIGVPLTLLKLEQQHEFAVIEMGADRQGEIEFSVRVTVPDIALITNASAAHIEGFGSLDGIVQAKGEIIDGLKDSGVLLLNADDSNCEKWQRRAGSKRTVLFSRENAGKQAAYYGRDIRVNSKAQTTFDLVAPIGERTVSMNLLGKHNVSNAIAAAAVALEAGVTLDVVAAGLAKVSPVRRRLYPLPGIKGSLVIDDSYNASPNSFCAAIDVLMCHEGARYLIAGDMKELGVETDEAHSLVGRYAAKAGVEQLLAVGEQCKLMVAAFGEGARLFENKSALLAACKDLANSEATFLVKGSRGAKMDTVVDELTQGEES